MNKRINILLLMALIFVGQPARAGFFKDLCAKILGVVEDPWPYSKYSNQELYDESKSNLNDDLKKEISFRLISIKLSRRDQDLLESTLGNKSVGEQ